MIYIIYIKLLVQKYDFFLEKPLIPARISHFPCKIIDFLINFHQLLVSLHLFKNKTYTFYGVRKEKLSFFEYFF